MKLYCAGHKAPGQVHDLTPVQVERIVYALVGMYADELTELHEGRLHVGEFPDDNFPCLLEVWRISHDPEVYLEHVDAFVETRSGGTATARCDCTYPDGAHADTACTNEVNPGHGGLCTACTFGCAP